MRRFPAILFTLATIVSEAMSGVKIGDRIWVKLPDDNVWWPSAVISMSAALTIADRHDHFSRVGYNDLLKIEFLGASATCEAPRVAVLSLSGEGQTWDRMESIDHSIQCIPESLKAMYNTALKLLGEENFCSEETVLNNMISIGRNEMHGLTSCIVCSKDQAVESRRIANISLEAVAINPTAVKYATSLAEGNDSEGLTNPNERIFSESIDPNSLQLLNNKCTVNKRVLKRQNVVPWDDYFMSVAFLSAMRSKDPSTQVGACIVNPDKRIVGIGYNGFPRGCSDDELPWARIADDELDTKYPYVCHAEVNAILNKNSAEVRGCSIYVALFPCNDCAKIIIQSGICEVVYLSDKYKEQNTMKASKKMLLMAGVKLRQYCPTQPHITIDFSSIE